MLLHIAAQANMLASKFHMCTDGAKTALFKAAILLQKHVLFWLHFYVWSGTVYVSLYKHTWFRLSADLKQTFCWWLKHTHTEIDPLSGAELDQPKTDQPCIHLWFGRGYEGWIHIYRQTHGYTHQHKRDRGLKWVQLCSQMCFWVLWLRVRVQFVCVRQNLKTYPVQSNPSTEHSFSLHTRPYCPGQYDPLSLSFSLQLTG